MKVDNKRYILKMIDHRTAYTKSSASTAFKSVKELKAMIPKGERASADIRIKIQRARQILKTPANRYYSFNLYLKRYKHKTVFDFEFNKKYGSFAKQVKDHINGRIGAYRKENRDVFDTNTYFGDERYVFKVIGDHFSRGGWVHSEPGQVYNVNLKRRVRSLYEPKEPKEKYKCIGLELEFCAPIKELDFALILWDAGVHKYAQMKKDGSLRPKVNEIGYELALLLPEHNFRRHLRHLCGILEKVGARADERRCGLHVHLDMRRGRKKDVVYNNLIACQNVFFTFLDPLRRDNEFCHTVSSRKFPIKFDNTREERYKSINAASYYKYKTLEVRMHQGSVDYKDIANWMELLIKIANHKIRLKKDINELTDLRKRVRINAKMSQFFQDKVCFWQLQGPQRRVPPATSGGIFRSAAASLADEVGRTVPDQPPAETRRDNV